MKMQIKQIFKYVAYWWGMGAGMQRGRMEEILPTKSLGLDNPESNGQYSLETVSAKGNT